MTLFQFKRIARWSVLRAALLGAVGIITLLLPEFCGGGVIYAAVVYIILNGATGIINFISIYNEPDSRACTEEKHIAYLNLFAAISAIIFGILGIVYFRYLVSILPVFLGALLLIESGIYFLVVFCVESKLKALLTILSLLVMAGGVVLIAFTFGFGGLLTLARILSTLLFLSCAIELLIGLIYRNLSVN